MIDERLDISENYGKMDLDEISREVEILRFVSNQAYKTKFSGYTKEKAFMLGYRLGVATKILQKRNQEKYSTVSD